MVLTWLVALNAIPLPRDGIINQSCIIQPGQYHRRSDGDDPAITIRGENITVDFQNAEILGTPITVEPDQRQGTGIVVQGKNIVLKNLRVRGYKVGVRVDGCPGFMLLDSDLSYNWKPRLKSTLDKEDPADWMSFHQNEKDEWLDRGAAIYIKQSDGFKLRNVKSTGGQCGAMLSETNKGTIANCAFEFLSGVGIGLYRSSNNTIMHNKVDWCVRGYSHGKWNRGQDSAGLLMYEQSNKNVVAYNSITHGGDGLFLWAGQSTMDTGKGGCNDNLFYGNDFSHAPTNGIEATFSRNAFANNLVQECWHGLWGGYSYDSSIVGNHFTLNSDAIAIEQGQNNTITHNEFDRNLVGLRIWERESQPSDWGYAKNRDVQSKGYEVRGNAFRDTVSAVFELGGVSGFNAWQNTFSANGRVLGQNAKFSDLVFSGNTIRTVNDSSTSSLVGKGNMTLRSASARPKPALMRPDGNVRTELKDGTREYLQRFVRGWNPIKEKVAPSMKRFFVPPDTYGNNPFLRDGTLRGRRYILVDEWGPYDFRSPILWPRETKVDSGQRAVVFEVLGPRGRWRVKSVRGAKLEATTGSVPGSLRATLTGADVSIQLEYRGAQTVDYRGVVTSAGNWKSFGWRDFNVPIDWHVRFWPYDPAKEEPRSMERGFRDLLSTPPSREEHVSALDYGWSGAPYSGGPKDHFATVAEGRFTIGPGEYTASIGADDGVRLWLDDQLLIDEWHYSPPATYERRVKLGGSHRIRIEHFEIDGYAQLKFGLAR